MADKELSELNPAGPLTGTDTMYIVQGGQSYEVTLSDLAAFVQTAQSIVPANLPHRGARAVLSADITGLSWPFIATWGNVDFDTDGFWNIGDSTKLVVPAGVTKVRLTANIAFESLTSAGSVFAAIRMNETGTAAAGYIPQAKTTPRNSSTGFNDNAIGIVSGVIEVVEGDYFDVRTNASMTNQDQILADGSFFEIEVIEYEGATESLTV